MNATMDIIVSLNEDFFEAPQTMMTAQFVIWAMDHKMLRKGEMRYHDYSNARGPAFGKFRRSAVSTNPKRIIKLKPGKFL